MNVLITTFIGCFWISAVSIIAQGFPQGNYELCIVNYELSIVFSNYFLGDVGGGFFIAFKGKTEITSALS